MTTIQTSNGSSTHNGLSAGFKKRAGGSIMDCHNQWKTRPADEAVADVAQLLQRTQAARAACMEREGIAWTDLEVLPTMRGDLCLAAGDVHARFTNYSLAQLCGLPGTDGGVAPHSFVTKLSADTAAAVLNERLQASRIQRKNQASLLVQGAVAGQPSQIRSITTEAYERVWDHDLALRIADLCERGTWGPAEAFKRAGGAVIDNAWGELDAHPLGWVGDRSMFVCLVDYEGGIEHEGNTYARFFLLSNSEVGAGALKITFGLMDFACSNFILWGCQEVYEAVFRHTRSIHERWAVLSAGLNRQLASENRGTIITGINAARGVLLGADSEQVIAKVQSKTGLPKGIVGDAYNVALATPRYGDARSVWGMVNGLTEVSQRVAQNADKRVSIDSKAASLMELAR